MNKHWKVTVTIQPPGFGEPFNVAIDLDRHTFDLNALPRAREIVAQDAYAAMKQLADRDLASKFISQQLAPMLSGMILQALEQQDTINGYPREEFLEFGKPPKERRRK